MAVPALFSCSKDDDASNLNGSAPRNPNGKTYRSTEIVGQERYLFFTSDSTIEDWQYSVPVDFNNGQKLKDLEYSYTQPNLTINPGMKGECIIVIGGKSFSLRRSDI